MRSGILQPIMPYRHTAARIHEIVKALKALVEGQSVSQKKHGSHRLSFEKPLDEPHELNIMPENNQPTESVAAERDPSRELGRARNPLKNWWLSSAKPHEPMTYFLFP
jgi:hypothetical protein